MGKAIDLGNTMALFNTSESSRDADAIALFSDWAATGNDIRAAAERLTHG